jgi:hypothetical protein
MATNGPLNGRAPVAPSMRARSLVLWVGDRQGLVLDQSGPDVVGSVAMRLSNAARNFATLRRARLELGLGVGFDSEAWSNQCRPDHQLRRPAFRALGYDARDLFGRERLDIDRPLSSAQVADYAAAHLEAQIKLDATIFQCPGHVVASPVGRGNDIALAEETLDLVARRALREPADSDQHEHRRSAFATICVHPDELDAEGIRSIVDRYVRLPVDGYWVWAMGFLPSGIQAERVLRLVLALQENSGRPACPGGLSHLWQSALARGAAGAITGPDRGAVAFEPEQGQPPPRNPDDEERGRQVHIYHGAILGSFALGERGEEARRRAFARNPCSCGQHDARVPPQGRREIAAHNQWWRLREARLACTGNAARASRELEQRIASAQAERPRVGIQTPLPAGWRQALRPWDEAPVGWGAAGGRAA